ncbi:MAG: hypothetical protein NZ473_03555 [Candidatus Kapabacteria bacterium]|nr:hypothetical protein [Candidatus Kapabacteria bacterium]MCS7169048.1 hypothetical protein [Candidatus Kapabacteria bacterium]MDW7997767.1 hypothetical protein [Bacteroidota bacterium]MDW8224725.1 hypothetical protein [Bacteroidota bacterium]
MPWKLWAVGAGLCLATLGCIVWRVPEPARIAVVELSPEPGIPLAEDPVRSALGDMLFFLPKGWFVLNLGERAPAGMVAVGVNPEYTLALTVLLLRQARKDSAGQYNLVELAQQSFARRQARTAGAIRLASDFTIVRIGPKTFVLYRFKNGVRYVRVAVFASSIGTVYEVALVPLSLRAIDPPSEEECSRLFEGVLRAVQF